MPPIKGKTGGTLFGKTRHDDPTENTKKGLLVGFA